MLRRSRLQSETGASAVEFALVLPVLLILLLGLIEFGVVFNIQISLSNAAREGARTMAIHNDAGQAKAAAKAAAPSINPAITTSQITVGTCLPGQSVRVKIDYPVQLMTGFFGASIPLRGEGVMRCGG